MADFFSAGTDTTTSSLSWAVLYLLRYPDIQTKLQNEIDTVVGKSRLTSLADRNRLDNYFERCTYTNYSNFTFNFCNSSLPYTEAFIMELLRISSVVSYGVPHAVTQDVEFHGYQIPKGTSVYASIYSTHYDPEVWGDPENFRPERFLSSDGLKVVKHESLIPFSAGKRQCPGKTLARDQLFLFVTTLAQTFRICNEEGSSLPTLEPVTGKMTLEPCRYSVVMKERL